MDGNSKKIRLTIAGMTCVNCQNRIENALSRANGVVQASVSYNNGTADVVYDEAAISRKQIVSIIKHLDYDVVEGASVDSNLVNTICLLVIIVALYIMLQSFGVLNLLVPSQLADTGMGYGMLFVIGLVTSVHCIAMCGGINLSQCIPQLGTQDSDANGRLATFRPAIAYNFGRVVSYTAVGFVLGFAGFLIGGGAEIGLSAFLQGILKIIAGMFMVIMGINMLGLFPGLRKFTIRMPKFLARKIGKEKAKTTRPFVVGILNGFMPCGPLQSMWIVALASGNPFSGALSMFLFSLGTVPLMLGLGSIVSALGKKFTDKVMTVGAVLVVVLGLAMLSQGGSLSGWLPPDLLLILVIGLCVVGVVLSLPVEKRAVKYALRVASVLVIVASYGFWSYQGAFVRNGSTSGAQAEVSDGVQVVNSTLLPGSYPSITVQAGVPVRWVIDAPEQNINGCNYRFIIRDYGIEHTFQPGENVIEFIPTTVGTVGYTCWMGMIRGNIFVTDGSGGGTVALGAEVNVPTATGYDIPTEALAIASLAMDAYGDQVQEVSIELTDEGFNPAVVVVQQGQMVYWNIDNKMSDAESGTQMLVPYYSTKLTLGSGINQIGLDPTESFDVSTGDNRFYCYVKTVDDITAIDEEAIREEVSAYDPIAYPMEIYEAPAMSCCG